MEFGKIRVSRFAIGLLALASGCATVSRGTTEVLTVNSAPDGATVSMSNGERCLTPCTVEIKRKFPVAVEVCKAGYAPVLAHVFSQISSDGMVANLLLGGVIGASIDASTGAMRDLRPNPLVVTLELTNPGCLAPMFPALPTNGQSPDDHARERNRLGPRQRRAASHGNAASVAAQSTSSTGIATAAPSRSVDCPA